MPKVEGPKNGAATFNANLDRLLLRSSLRIQQRFIIPPQLHAGRGNQRADKSKKQEYVQSGEWVVIIYVFVSIIFHSPRLLVTNTYVHPSASLANSISLNQLAYLIVNNNSSSISHIPFYLPASSHCKLTYLAPRTASAIERV